MDVSTAPTQHGSYVADTNGDEERYGEVLCPYDIDDNDVRDDELQQISGSRMKEILLSGN